MEYPDVGEELKRVAKDRAKVVKEENRTNACKTVVTSDNEVTSSSSYCIITDEAVDRHLKETMEQMKEEILSIKSMI